MLPTENPPAEEPPVSSATGRPLTKRGQQTRRRLLEAAEQVFADLGYHEASIVKITEHAGVALGTFYLYFDGKQAIFDELVLDLNSRVRHSMSESMASATNRIEAERLGFEGFFRFTAAHPALYRVVREAEFVSPTMLRLHYERIVDGYRAGLAAAQRDGEIAAELDTDVVAWALMGAGELIGMRYLLWERDAAGKPPAQIDPAVLDGMSDFITRALRPDHAENPAPGARPHVTESLREEENDV
ncbi:TetR/AcrR family transcriptional regulator [Microbacterium esteraromaticum]|uniref:TetR/AcrR family transcriptional regulator n=1 Tax=Microbacterium esteraromaticum TaxID=57043 RepID=UPI0019D3D94B|nr:TetR/AcrR family transcriptional regulator [Microbacterium esteraromaticum]MBN7792815.1 TetR/AcrR family transcriptional regulator [Microbacterium esteraromaticum]MBN8423589.1 TetR/AcrR family transcriptional regulator [Microbacterium esteraromaticum]MBY6060890.1 TetR/AcrR family transcriptional regulator [Microbacterium esteraromaticum]MCA1306076.1 TetR/AcrR family transcriptional regulator [Microbacterium esteraromaticum]